MLKKLMATTAMVVIASTAYAADSQNNNAAMAPTADHYVTNVDTSDLLATTLIGQTVYSGSVNGAAMAPKAGANMQAQNDQKMNKGDKAAANNNANIAANNANNMPVTGAPQGEQIGDINNLVVAKDGSIDAVVIGVGGFLGMGEKNVAVPFASLSWSTDGNGNTYAYLAATKDQLKNAPEFDVASLQKRPTAQAMNPAAPGAANPANPNAQAMNPAAPGAANPANPNPNGQVAAQNQPAPGTDQNVAAANNNNNGAFDATKISANDLINTTVYDADNQNVGDVGDVIVTKDGKIDAVVVDVGGFLGIGEKPVAIAFEDLQITKDENGNLVAATPVHQGPARQRAAVRQEDVRAESRSDAPAHAELTIAP